MSERAAPPPFVWTILYLPFGALNGFVTVALTFLATRQGLSISEGALLNGAQMVSQWLKWVWAPVVDVTMTPRKWYVLSTTVSAFGVFLMAAVPLGPATLGLVLAVIAVASLVNSAVGMAVEAMIGECTPPDKVGSVSAWLQAGNLGGVGLGGALGLYLMLHLPARWMGGVVMAGLFMACCLALYATPREHAREEHESATAAVKSVVLDLRAMLRTKGGILAALLCVLPIGTGSAQVVLAQAEVASYWHAGAGEVELLQGLFAGLLTTAGCFAGGYVCQRIHPRHAYAMIGVLHAVITTAMALAPATVHAFVVGSLIYSFAIGLSYAAFTAFVLLAMGKGSGATKYNIYASLSNFPLWWLGLVLGVAAQHWGARGMLLVEAAFGVVGVGTFLVLQTRVRRSRLAEGS